MKQLTFLLKNLAQGLGLARTPALQPIPVAIQRGTGGAFHGVRPMDASLSRYPISASGDAAQAYRSRHAGSG